MRAWWTTIRFPHFMAWHVDTLLRNLSCIWHAKHVRNRLSVSPNFSLYVLARASASVTFSLLFLQRGATFLCWYLAAELLTDSPFHPDAPPHQRPELRPLWNSFKSPKEEEPQPVGCFRYCLVAAQLTSFFFTWYMIDFTEFCFVTVNNHMGNIRVQFSLCYEEQLMINSSFWKCFRCFSRCGS